MKTKRKAPRLAGTGGETASKLKLNYILFCLFSQVRSQVKTFIVNLALWCLIPHSWTDYLLGGAKND